MKIQFLGIVVFGAWGLVYGAHEDENQKKLEYFGRSAMLRTQPYQKSVQRVSFGTNTESERWEVPGNGPEQEARVPVKKAQLPMSEWRERYRARYYSMYGMWMLQRNAVKRLLSGEKELFVEVNLQLYEQFLQVVKHLAVPVKDVKKEIYAPVLRLLKDVSAAEGAEAAHETLGALLNYLDFKARFYCYDQQHQDEERLCCHNGRHATHKKRLFNLKKDLADLWWKQTNLDNAVELQVGRQDETSKKSIATKKRPQSDFSGLRVIAP